MLFRNSLRLVFSRKANDLITIGFLSNGKDLYAANLPDGAAQFQESLHEIRAHVGAFNSITWRFGGELVETDALVKHYLSEFIRNSAS